MPCYQELGLEVDEALDLAEKARDAPLPVASQGVEVRHGAENGAHEIACEEHLLASEARRRSR